MELPLFQYNLYGKQWPTPMSDRNLQQGKPAPLVVVVGPTGAGKSDLAISLALEFDGEVVNCDSVQVYRHFYIGTAKVPLSERRGVPHHLLDIVEPGERFTAGDYAREARRVLRQIRDRGKLSVLVGGTGFYLRALLEGLFVGPSQNQALRAWLVSREQARPGLLHRFIRRIDPESAKRIHQNDRNKLVRAAEVYALSRLPMSELFQSGRDPLMDFHAIKIGLNPPRKALYHRLDRRAEAMVAAGLVEEVQRLLNAGIPQDAKPFESIGYAQTLKLLRGEMCPAEALQSLQQDTRRYAKRQGTWFARERDILWLPGFGNDETMVTAAMKAVRAALTELEKIHR